MLRRGLHDSSTWTLNPGDFALAWAQAENANDPGRRYHWTVALVAAHPLASCAAIVLAAAAASSTMSDTSALVFGFTEDIGQKGAGAARTVARATGHWRQQVRDDPRYQRLVAHYERTLEQVRRRRDRVAETEWFIAARESQVAGYCRVFADRAAISAAALWSKLTAVRRVIAEGVRQCPGEAKRVGSIVVENPVVRSVGRRTFQVLVMSVTVVDVFMASVRCVPWSSVPAAGVTASLAFGASGVAVLQSVFSEKVRRRPVPRSRSAAPVRRASVGAGRARRTSMGPGRVSTPSVPPLSGMPLPNTAARLPPSGTPRLPLPGTPRLPPPGTPRDPDTAPMVSPQNRGVSSGVCPPLLPNQQKPTAPDGSVGCPRTCPISPRFVSLPESPIDSSKPVHRSREANPSPPPSSPDWRHRAAPPRWRSPAPCNRSPSPPPWDP
eukprot:Hpha_TRINITY_DN3773_c0_g1::TRINITY_DN3773_c0_g1_i1::g.23863::m.23863